MQNNRIDDCFGFEINPYISEIHFDGGEPIIREGEQPVYLYYLEQGRAKVFHTHENGRVSLTSFMEAPCFAGEMEFLEARTAAKGVMALTPCSGYAIHVNEQGCRDQLLSDPKFLRTLCMFLSRKSVNNTETYLKNQAFPLKARLADFILTASHGGVYRERYTEVSEFLGVSYRHLLYVLADFVKAGILEKRASGYYIKDEKVLWEISCCKKHEDMVG